MAPPWLLVQRHQKRRREQWKGICQKYKNTAIFILIPIRGICLPPSTSGTFLLFLPFHLSPVGMLDAPDFMLSSRINTTGQDGRRWRHRKASQTTGGRLSISLLHGMVDCGMVLYTKEMEEEGVENKKEEKNKLEKSVIYQPLCAHRDVKLKIDLHLLQGDERGGWCGSRRSFTKGKKNGFPSSSSVAA